MSPILCGWFSSETSGARLPPEAVVGRIKKPVARTGLNDALNLAGQRFRQLVADLFQQGLHHARVTAHDVAAGVEVVATGKVGGDGTGFTGDQFACGQIPRLEPQLPVAIDATGGDIYRPTRSRTFSIRSGSGETLNSSWRHGFSPNARQISDTL